MILARKRSYSPPCRPLKLRKLLLGEGRPHHRHGLTYPCLVQSQHIRVPLYGYDPTHSCSKLPRFVQAKQLLALAIQLVLGGIHVFRPLILPQGACSETQYTPARIGEREHDPGTKAIVEAPLPPP